MSKERIRNQALMSKVVSAEEAAALIKDGMTIGTSGFTPAGYPKAVPLAVAKRAEAGEQLRLNLYTGASVGKELDGAWAKAGIINMRMPYQTNGDLRNLINSGDVNYQDVHLSQSGQQVREGFWGKIDVAIIEAVAITEDGGIIPATSVGNSNVYVEMAEKVIIEINSTQPLALEGMHDIHSPLNPPNRKVIPIEKSDDRIGTTYIPCDPSKIAAIVMCDIPDDCRPIGEPDEDSKKISGHLIDFLECEVKAGRLPENLLPLQSGVGSVANAVLGGIGSSKFENLTSYTEVLQDSMLDLIDSGKIKTCSCTSVTLSPDGVKRFYDNIDFYKDKVIMRPQEISNNPEVARRLGVMTMNTAIEVDLFANVNSTHIMGTRLMNGLGGSGDFTRNGYMTFFTTVSTAKNGDISSIVPMVSHIDHTEHEVMIIVTEQGLADCRGTSPKQRAEKIIKNCAHPDYRPMLEEYFARAQKEQKHQHTPHLIGEALAWHERFNKTGSMKLK